MVREWPDSRHVYYGTAAERAAFPAAGEAAGALFFDYDDEILYKWDGAAWVAMATIVTPPADHTHAGAGTGGQLDWDVIWIDAAHDHSAAGEGGQNLHAIAELEFEDPTELTISGGNITRTQVYHTIAPESGVSDILDNIFGGSNGDVLVIKAKINTTIIVMNEGGNVHLGIESLNYRLENVGGAAHHLALIYNAAAGQWAALAPHDPFQSGIDPAEHSHTKLVATDGDPDPAWSTDAAGNLQGAPDLVIDLDERSTAPGTPAAGYRRLLAAVDGFWQGDDGGSVTPLVAEHFRAGMRVESVDNGNVRVSAGVLEFNGLLLKEQQDSGLIALATGGNWLSGSEGASMWVYIYATDDGAGGCTFKLSDEPPLYHECDTASLVFFAQVNGEPAASATTFNYDNDTGEANIRAGDELRAWTDSDYGTVRGGLKVVSVNTGTNEFTVVANAVNLADNDYLTITKGIPRYRQYAGAWYRCLGAVRNDGSSNLYPIFPRNGQNVVQYADAPSNHRALSLGTQTSATDVALATFIPPYSVQALAQVTLESGTGSKYIIMRPDGVTASIALLQGVPAMAFTLLIQCDYFQEIEYLVSASTEATIDIVGWEEII